MIWRCFCKFTEFEILNAQRFPKWMVKARCKKCKSELIFTKHAMYRAKKIFPAPMFSRVKGVEP